MKNLIILAAGLASFWVASACTQQKSPQPKTSHLTAQQAFDILKDLNEQKKLAEPFGVPPFGREFYYSALRPENCFGLILANGLRLVGESLGKDYGIIRGDDFQQIGFLYSEGDFLIEKYTFKKGPYIVFASPSKLIIGTGFVDINAEEIPLKTMIADSLFKEGGKRPRFSLTEANDNIYINVESNKLLITH